MRSDPLDALIAFDEACANGDEDAARAVSVDFDADGDSPGRMYDQASRKGLRLKSPVPAWIDGHRAIVGAFVLPEGGRVPVDLAWMLAERSRSEWSVAGFVRGDVRAGAWMQGWLGADPALELLPVDDTAGPFLAVLQLALTTGDTLPLRVAEGVRSELVEDLRAACNGQAVRFDALRALPGTDRRGLPVHFGEDTWGLVLRRAPDHVELLGVRSWLSGTDLLEGLEPLHALWERGRESTEDPAQLGFDAKLAREAAAKLRGLLAEARSSGDT